MSKNLEAFKNSYWWGAHGSKIDPSTEGIWEVRGEDPNCDWGGHHHQPYLGTYKGTFDQVVNIAVDLPNFMAWGSGGTITKIDVQEVPKPGEDPFKNGGTFEGKWMGYTLVLKHLGHTLSITTDMGVRGMLKVSATIDKNHKVTDIKTL